MIGNYLVIYKRWAAIWIVKYELQEGWTWTVILVWLWYQLNNEFVK